MQKKSSATSTRNHPRIPSEHGGVQVNHCKSPVCVNYGVPAEQTSARGSNRYTLNSRNKGISSCICTSCGVGFPLKSNIGIVEEVERMASYLSAIQTAPWSGVVLLSSIINRLTQRLAVFPHTAFRSSSPQGMRVYRYGAWTGIAHKPNSL